MKAVYIVPGSGGGFYCQNCMRDGALVRALRDRGHDVFLAPLYLPLFLDTPEDAAAAPVFYGAVSVYLKEKIPLLRRLPAGLLRWLDSRPMLKLAARRAGSTEAAGLEELTLSVLRGEEGRQTRELGELVEWLATDIRPDIVHLSNGLLVGLAREIKQRLGVPIVCSLQDEHTWIDAMRPPQDRECWELISARGEDIDAFLPVSEYYAGVMRQRLSLPEAKLRVVPLGIDVAGYEPSTALPSPPVLGYLSRLSEGLGFGLLVDAFIALKKRPGLEDLRLCATGGKLGADVRFVEGLEEKLGRAGIRQDTDFSADFDREARICFLQSLSVLCVPIPGGEAFGAFQLEAMAAGIPVVQPAAGAFPEVVAATGGGVTCAADDPDALVEALAALLLDPKRMRQLGERGRQSVLADYTIDAMGTRTLAVYEALLR